MSANECCSSRPDTSYTDPSTSVPFHPHGLRLALDSVAPSGHRLNTVNDVLALTIHACLALVGFKLFAQSDFAELNPPFLQPLTPLPNDWNTTSSSTGTFLFKYRHDKSALTLIVKLVVMGPSLLVHAMTLPDNRISNATFTPTSLVSTDVSLPVELNSALKAQTLITSNDETVDQFLCQVKQLILTLIPNLSSLETFRSQSSEKSSSANLSIGDFGPGITPKPRATVSPQIPPQVPLVPSYHESPTPFSIGHQDLDPLGGMSPIGPTPFGGRNRPGSGRLGPFGNEDTGGGSIMGPGHPLFSGGIGINPRGPPRYWGGDQLLPPGAVPSGARFDPIGPVGPGSVGPRPMGSGQPNRPPYFPSGEPDNDEFMPPRPTNPSSRSGGGFGGGFPDMYM